MLSYGQSVTLYALIAPTETVVPVIGAELTAHARPPNAYANRPTTVFSSTLTRPAVWLPSRSSSAIASTFSTKMSVPKLTIELTAADTA